ncbi:MAG: NUDIX hydrolase [Lachnospiraceae bacterium]
MGYILELRKQVGHRPLIMTCAGVLLLNEKRELLLQKRADNGLWGYPGGSMELGDSFEDCARREVQEETGLICGNLEHFMNVSGEEVHYVYPNGDEIYAAEEIFLCRKFSGQIICQQEEVEKLCFFRMDELPSKEQINPNNYPAIERLRRMMDENHRETI